MIPHVMELKKAGADAVLLFVTPGHVARIIGTGKAMQFEPTWMSSSTCGDFPLMMAITKGLSQGMITASFGLAEPTGHVGEVQLLDNPVQKMVAKYKTDAFDKFAAQDERYGYTFLAGIGFAEPLVEAIRRCGKDLTREKLVKELENMQNFKGVLGRINYKPFDPKDPTCRLGQGEVFLQECTENGGSKILTDWVKTVYLPSKAE